jgi:type VI secretion system protein ImpK
MPDQARHLPLFGDGAENAAGEDDTRRLSGGAAADARAPAGDAVRAPPPPAGSGVLVRHAWPLLALLARLRQGASSPDPEALKTALAAQIRAFDQSALAAGLDPRQVSAARYTLCTALDEAVSTSAAGERSDWAQASLLSTFHGETWGGEKVFTLIERTLAEPRRYTDLLELFYFVLALGFQGKFRLERDGTAAVDALRDRLFDALQRRFGSRTTVPTPTREPVGRRARLIRYLPVWTVAALCLLLSLLTFVWLDYQLKSHAHEVAHAFNAVAATSEPGGPS